MRVACVVLIVVAWSAPSRADKPLFGATVGLRMTDLQGNIDTDVSARFAVAGIVALPGSRWWRVVVEPGVRSAGADKYALTYLALPVLGQLTVPLSTGSIVRASAGVMANVLVNASVVDDSGPVEARRWDIGLVAGLGFEQRSLFAEVRWSRGIRTIHAAEPALFVVNTEIGLWIGVLR